MANDKYREDIHRALEKDNGPGQVWKFSQEGLDARSEANVATSGFVYSYRSYIEAIEDGTLPVAPELGSAGHSAKFRKASQEAPLP